MGKTLLEKLLWSFPRLSCIYILIREKNGKDAQQRFAEFCEHKIFERLRSHYPQRLRKLKFLAGNIEKENFGKFGWFSFRLIEAFPPIQVSAMWIRKFCAPR